MFTNTYLVQVSNNLYTITIVIGAGLKEDWSAVEAVWTSTSRI